MAVPSLDDRAQRVAARMAEQITGGGPEPADLEPPPLPDMEALMTGEPVEVAQGDPELVAAALPPNLETAPRAARPFPRGGSGLDHARAQQCLTTAIYYEAATEPTDGKRAVAQVVLNRVLHPAFPNTVCGVVYQGSERWTGCQFSFTCDGSLARAPARRKWVESAQVAARALAGSVFAPVGLATHYHTWRVWPRWGRTLVSTATVGAHIFHRLRGYWGTAIAFRGGYLGGEPLPGPHARSGPAPTGLDDPLAPPAPSILADTAPVTPSAPGTPVAERATAPPPPTTVAGARTPLETRAGRAAESSDLPTSTIRPEFAESGRWKDAPAR